MTPPAVAAPTRPRPSGPASRRATARRPATVRTAARPAAGGPRIATARATTARPAARRVPAGTGVEAAGGRHLVHRLATLPDSRLVDRMVRGRVWIAVLAVGLVGIVFLQISLLKLNTGISRSVETQQTLERQNASLKTELSSLGGSERVRGSAAAMGFVSPITGQPRFVDAGRASADRAAANIVAPAPIEQLPIGLIPPQDGGTGAATPDAVSAPVGAPAAPAVAVTPPAAEPVTPVVPPAPAVAASPVAAPAPAAVAVAPAPVAPAPAADASTGGLAASGQG